MLVPLKRVSSVQDMPWLSNNCICTQEWSWVCLVCILGCVWMTNHFEVCSVTWSQHTECAHEVGLVSTVGRQSFSSLCPTGIRGCGLCQAGTGSVSGNISRNSSLHFLCSAELLEQWFLVQHCTITLVQLYSVHIRVHTSGLMITTGHRTKADQYCEQIRFPVKS